jgi:2-dehydro-3-deoxyphosphogluconate aldolase / (4S)-4-hydroxy-2-oxoglutarate aldolase
MINAEDVRQAGIIAVLRGDFSVAGYLRAAEALLSGGIRLIEVTLDGREALPALSAIRQRFGSGANVGAGTVRCAADAQRAISSGAEFLVSPNLDEPTVRLAQRHRLLHLPGVLTPTETARALALGCTMVKLFPAEPLGPGYLRALRGPLPELAYVPTGGLAEQHVPGYVAAGAAALGFGSELVSGPHQQAGDIAARARRLRAALDEARSGADA